MGLDRKLFVSNRWDVGDIKDTIESIFKVKVTYRATHSPDYATLLFKFDDGEVRSMNCHINSERGGFKGLLLSLGANGKSDEIFKKLAERLGGFYNEQDCDNNFVEYPYQAAENLEFHLKDAMKTGSSDGSNLVDFRKFLEVAEKQHIAWKEENRKSIAEHFNKVRK